MLPKVIVYNAVSLDGLIDGVAFDIAKYYALAGRFGEDTTLCGSETILAGLAMEGVPNEEKEPAAPRKKDAHDDRALLAVADSRGRVRCWSYLRSLPYWRDAVALVSKATPREYLDHLRRQGVEHIAAGEGRVDLRAALEEMNTRYGSKTVRVDSGGTLNGALLREGLVREVALLVHPVLVGGTSSRSFFRAPDLDSPEGGIRLKLVDVERLEGDLLWLRYEVAGE